MIDIEHRCDIDLPAQTVWEEMRHFDRVLYWIPRGDESSIRISGEGVGMIRDIELATMGYVQHRLLAFDDKKRMFSYRLTGGKPLGMQDYTVVATVTAVDDDHCIIRWVGRMTGDGSLDEAEIGRALEMALGNMTIGIIAVLKCRLPEYAQQLLVDY